MNNTGDTPLIIMDGGMGRELERMGAPFKQPEWSALALMEAPETVRAAHDNFIHAGAEVIITNSYAIVPFHIGQERFNDQGRDLIALSGKLAREAANNAPHKVIVAGSIPPLFGSYNPDAFCEEQATDILTPFIEEQIDHVDIWIIETISSIAEGEFVARELSKTGKPIWASFTLTDRQDRNATPTIRSENTVENAVNAAMNWKNTEAILFNCSQPEEMMDAIIIAKSILHDTIHIGAYANNFEQKTKKGHLANEIKTPLNEKITPEIYGDLAQNWKDAGATIIGGCCGIGPDYISYLKEHLS